MNASSINLSENFRLLYNDVGDGLNLLIQKATKLYPNLKVSINDLKDVIEAEFDTEPSTVVTSIATLLANISILAYLQEFDNDKNFDKLKEFYTSKKSDSDTSSNKFANIELDFKFGFNGIIDLIQCGVEKLESSEIGQSSVEGKLTANLLSNIRDIDAKDYLFNGYIEKDLALIVLLNESPDEAYNPDIIDFIKRNHDLHSSYETARESVLGVYKYAFQDSFGLRPYVGVLSFKGDCIYVVGDNFHLATLPKAESVFKKIATELSTDYMVVQSDLRQFDFNTIVSSQKPVYFPKKILEYALGRKLTYELSLNLYRPIEEAKSWEQYEDSYVKEQIDLECLHAIYKSLERHLKLDFNSDSFKNKWKTSKLSLEAKFSDMSLHDLIKSDLHKVVRSMCTGVVITSYNSLNNSVNSIALRIMDVYKNLSLNLTPKLFGSFSVNDSIVYYNGTNITEGRTLRDGNTPLPYNVIEFRHDFNSKLTEAEPLFGYTAVNLFKQRGIAIEWDRILLGEDIKGTPIFADLSDKDGIPLQANTVHNMMAGSRSGKGVMTMNILSVGLGSEKPIFYIDRKPDMSVMFYEMTDGNMFVVNGGQYIPKNDPRNVFSDTGVAIKGWENAYDKMPEYLKAVFNRRTYEGDFGDFVYFRAMYFCICLILARSAFSSDTSIYPSLGGNNGVIFVFDEFKNWQELFEQKFFTPNGVFGSHRLDKSMKKQYNNNLVTIENKIDMLNSGDLKPERAKAYERDVNNLRKENKLLIKPLDVYSHTLMDKYGETIKAVSTLLSAGFKDGEAPKTDIFVIGQHIEIDGYNGSTEKSGTYSERESGQFNCNENTKGKSLMRGLLDSFFHDWFMGYNEDGANQKCYMGANIEGSKANRLITKKHYWGYSNGTSMSTLRNSEPSETIYFKPYLVLNNALEDDPNNLEKIKDPVTDKEILNPDYTFVKQCRDRVNEAVPNLWETVRKKHLISGYTVTDDEKWYGHLNQGIGFEGLASAVCQTRGIVLDKETTLKSSLDIANFVANQMGYSSYKELLFDFSPEGLFSSDDMIFAIKNGAEAYKSKLSSRLSLFSEYKLLDDESSESSVESDRDYAQQEFDKLDFGFNEDNHNNDSYSSSPNPLPNPLPSPHNQTNDDPFNNFYDQQPQPEENSKFVWTKDIIRAALEEVIKSYSLAHPSIDLDKHLTKEFKDNLINVAYNILNS